MKTLPSIFDESDAAAEEKAWVEGVRAADEGRVVSHDAVTRWLLSWGRTRTAPSEVRRVVWSDPALDDLVSLRAYSVSLIPKPPRGLLAG